MKFVFIGLLVSLLIACSSSYQQTVSQDGTKSFLILTGNYYGTSMTIDGNAPIELTKENISSFKLDGADVAKFSLTSGTHRIRIVRNGQLVVDRKIYVSQGNTFEVVVK